MSYGSFSYAVPHKKVTLTIGFGINDGAIGDCNFAVAWHSIVEIGCCPEVSFEAALLSSMACRGNFMPLQGN